MPYHGIYCLNFRDQKSENGFERSFELVYDDERLSATSLDDLLHRVYGLGIVRPCEGSAFTNAVKLVLALRLCNVVIKSAKSRRIPSPYEELSGFEVVASREKILVLAGLTLVYSRLGQHLMVRYQARQMFETLNSKGTHSVLLRNSVTGVAVDEVRAAQQIALRNSTSSIAQLWIPPGDPCHWGSSSILFQESANDLGRG